MIIRNIIFDFDGTLADTSGMIVATMQAAIDRLGLPPRSDSECQAAIGLRLEEIPGVMWASDSVTDSATFAATYRAIFEERYGGNCVIPMFDGVAETLDRLRAAGFRMAIASSRSHRSLVAGIGGWKLDDLFEAVVGGDDVSEGKPSGEPVLAVTCRLGWLPAETLVVGDAVYDIMMGHNAGARTCAAAYGNQTPQQLAVSRPDFMIRHFAELEDLLLNVQER